MYFVRFFNCLKRESPLCMLTEPSTHAVAFQSQSLCFCTGSCPHFSTQDIAPAIVPVSLILVISCLYHSHGFPAAPPSISSGLTAEPLYLQFPIRLPGNAKVLPRTPRASWSGPDSTWSPHLVHSLTDSAAAALTSWCCWKIQAQSCYCAFAPTVPSFRDTLLQCLHGPLPTVFWTSPLLNHVPFSTSFPI